MRKRLYPSYLSKTIQAVTSKIAGKTIDELFELNLQHQKADE